MEVRSLKFRACVVFAVMVSCSSCGGRSGSCSVVSDPSNDSSSGVQLTEICSSTHKKRQTTIELSLSEKLRNLKANETIKVQIRLDTMIDEENPFYNSGRRNELGEIEVYTNDPALNKVLEGLNSEDKFAAVQERMAAEQDKNDLKRIEKSRKAVSVLLRKLEKTASDRFIRVNESAGIITAKLYKREILKLTKLPKYVLSITDLKEQMPSRI